MKKIAILIALIFSVVGVSAQGLTTTTIPMLGPSSEYPTTCTPGSLRSAAISGAPTAKICNAAGTGWMELSQLAASFTTGSVLFAGASGITQNNSNFFWDNTNSRLGVGTATPNVPIHIYGSNPTLRLQHSTAGVGTYMQVDASQDTYFWMTANRNMYFAINNAIVLWINQNSIRPITAGNTILGGSTVPFSELFLSGTSGTPGTNNFRFTGASTGGTRIITIPDASVILAGTPVLAFSATAPTVTSAGTSPSITASNGTAAFVVNVGTGGSATTIVLAMPTATTGWNCHATNITATAANRADQAVRQTASTTTSVTLQNQTVSTGAALAFTASDLVRCQCTAY